MNMRRNNPSTNVACRELQNTLIMVENNGGDAVKSTWKTYVMTGSK
jgi:hypothetical protein